MNSIEFLELELHEFLHQNQKKIDKGTINPLTVQFMIDEFTNAINKLKILKILRKNLDLEIIECCQNYHVYQVHINNLLQELVIDENEFNLIKDWLKNED